MELQLIFVVQKILLLVLEEIDSQILKGRYTLLINCYRYIKLPKSLADWLES